jgi:hypothetical protein
MTSNLVLEVLSSWYRNLFDWNRELKAIGDGRTLCLLWSCPSQQLNPTTQPPLSAPIPGILSYSQHSDHTIQPTQLLDSWKASQSLKLLKKLKCLQWEHLHCVCWSNVNAVHRSIFGTSTALLVLLQGLSSQAIMSTAQRAKDMRDIDVGLMLGDNRSRTNLDIALRYLAVHSTRCLSPCEVGDSSGDLPITKRRKACSMTRLPAYKDGVPYSLVPQRHSPNLLTFYEDFFEPQLPVWIKHAVDHWPALKQDSGREWKDLHYILSGWSCLKFEYASYGA